MMTRTVKTPANGTVGMNLARAQANAGGEAVGDMNFVPKARLLKSQHATTRPGQQVVSKSFEAAPYQTMKLRVCWQPSQNDINSGTGKASENVHEN